MQASGSEEAPTRGLKRPQACVFRPRMPIFPACSRNMTREGVAFEYPVTKEVANRGCLFVQIASLLAKLGFHVADHSRSRTFTKLLRKLPASRELGLNRLFFRSCSMNVMTLEPDKGSTGHLQIQFGRGAFSRGSRYWFVTEMADHCDGAKDSHRQKQADQGGHDIARIHCLKLGCMLANSLNDI